MQVRHALWAAVLCLCLAPALYAQDPVKVDPKHYTVVSENDQIRILRAHYGPHEKSVMHSHPANVAVFLSDSSGKFQFPDGKIQEFTTKTGDAAYSPALKHLPESGDKEVNVIIVELKGKPAATKSVAKTTPSKK